MSNRCNLRLDRSFTGEYTTFEDFIQVGRITGNIVNSMPWSFNYKGIPVSHENDTRYLLCVNNKVLNFTDNDILILEDTGHIRVVSKYIFESLYGIL